MPGYSIHQTDENTVVIRNIGTGAETCRVQEHGVSPEELKQRATKIVDALQLRDDMDKRVICASNPEQHVVAYGNGDAAWLVMYRNNDLFPWAVIERRGKDDHLLVAAFTDQEKARRYALRSYMESID